MRPAYITATRSHIRATIPKSCVMNNIARRVRAWISFRSARYWSWIVTSSAVVGSSAISARAVSVVQPQRLEDLVADREDRVERRLGILQDHRDAAAANATHLGLALR